MQSRWVSCSPREIYGILMARASAHKKIKGKKSRKIAHPTKKTKPNAASGSSHGKAASKAKAPSRKAKLREAMGKRRGASSSRRSAVKKRSKAMEVESRKHALKTGVAPAHDASPRLLRRTKTTAAALALLEKGIEFIFQKDFRKARDQLKMLLEIYPGELDILARARSYLQICDREEAIQKKPAVTTDQLYALGVLEHNKANYDTAISYFLKSLEKHPDADYIYYSVAASLAMKGNLAESMANLRKAVELNEDSRIYAKNDADFSALQTQKEFAELVGINQTPPSESQQ
jgi:tetratricopeptide (TPR) repeat protein